MLLMAAELHTIPTLPMSEYTLILRNTYSSM